jgi:hypothetical protein
MAFQFTFQEEYRWIVIGSPMKLEIIRTIHGDRFFEPWRQESAALAGRDVDASESVKNFFYNARKQNRCNSDRGAILRSPERR